MQLPADSMRMTAHIGEAAINNAQADLKNQYYDLKKFLLSGTPPAMIPELLNRQRASTLLILPFGIFASLWIPCCIKGGI